MSKETTTPKTPRVIDPAILALREQHKANVEQLRIKTKSADTLERIKVAIQKLTVEDLGKLRNLLKD